MGEIINISDAKAYNIGEIINFFNTKAYVVRCGN